MSRSVVLAVGLITICCCLGCGESKDRNPNPSLEHSNSPPPKRPGGPGTPSGTPIKP